MAHHAAECSGNLAGRLRSRRWLRTIAAPLAKPYCRDGGTNEVM